MALFALKAVNFNNIIKYPDIEIQEGETTFICGESGTGKSTLLKLLNGVLSPSDGQITYQGKNIENYDPILLRQQVLLVSQSIYLFDRTIKDNFNEYYTYRDLKPCNEETILKYLDICSLLLPLDNMCNILSGGERHRVFIAINLSFPSKVLMLDEPTSALDNKNAYTLIKNIKYYCKQNEKSLIIISHDRTLAERYADKTIVLSKGMR